MYVFILYSKRSVDRYMFLQQILAAKNTHLKLVLSYPKTFTLLIKLNNFVLFFNLNNSIFNEWTQTNFKASEKRLKNSFKFSLKFLLLLFWKIFGNFKQKLKMIHSCLGFEMCSKQEIYLKKTKIIKEKRIIFNE